MSSSNQITTQQQLFTELTAEEGANISGGASYTFKNRINSDIAFTLLRQGGQVLRKRLQPFGQRGDTLSVSIPERQVTVLFDSKLGQGFNPVSDQTSPGVSTFDLIGRNKVELFTPDDIVQPNILPGPIFV